jgi:hypothetical protein
VPLHGGRKPLPNFAARGGNVYTMGRGDLDGAGDYVRGFRPWFMISRMRRCMTSVPPTA